jgi:hypothetical protein
MKPLCFELTMCESNAADDCVNQYAEGVGEPIRRRRWRTNTPKALANCSPGLERQRQPWVAIPRLWQNPERVRHVRD